MDNIEVEVVCYDVVPVIYHLYGSYMDSLIQTTITNHNAQPAKVRLEVSVSHYTETDIQTLTLQPGEARTLRFRYSAFSDNAELRRRLLEANQHGTST